MLAHRPMLSLRPRNTRYQNLEKSKTNENCVTNYRPASNPHESKGSEIRYKILQHVVQHCFIASFGSMFPIFHLRDILVTQQIFLLQVEQSCCEKQSVRLLCATHFGFVACFSSNLQLVLDPHQAISALHFSNLQQNIFVA